MVSRPRTPLFFVALPSAIQVSASAGFEDELKKNSSDNTDVLYCNSKRLLFSKRSGYNMFSSLSV